MQPAMPAYAEHSIEMAEGCELHAYALGDGVITIAKGHTGVIPWLGRTPRLGDVVTPAQCDVLFKIDIHEKWSAVAAVADAHSVQLTGGQIGALVSLVFNIGVGYLGSEHTLGQRLAARDIDGVARSILLYENATLHGVHGPFLRARRRCEYFMFIGGPVPLPLPDTDAITALAAVPKE